MSNVVPERRAWNSPPDQRRRAQEKPPLPRCGCGAPFPHARMPDGTLACTRCAAAAAQ